METMPISITKISKTITIPGYIVDSKILSRVDEISKNAVSNPRKKQKLELSYWITKKSDEMLKFESFDKLISHANSEQIDIHSITMQYVVSKEAGISIEFFRNYGEIGISAYSNAPDFQFNIDRLLREIQKCEQEYNWFVKKFILKMDLPRIILMLIFFISLPLLFSVGYYFYALKVGINIDPAFIPSGTEYFREVEQAIKSDDLAKKLDILLSAQLRGFANVQDILQSVQTFSIFLLILLAIVTVLYFLARFVDKLYPTAFFEFDPQKKILEDIHRKRDIVWVGIVLGFIVNIIAGLAIAFLS